MNFELAEELLRAGFPMKRWGEVRVKHNDEGMETDSTYGFPSLSELISACGESLESIHFLHDMNMVTAHSSNSLVSKAITPEEAVAMLYLALNKQP